MRIKSKQKSNLMNYLEKKKQRLEKKEKFKG